jgi:hypothetical protein
MVAFSESGIRGIWGDEPSGSFRALCALSGETYDTDAYGNTLIFTAPGPDGTWFTDDDAQSNYGANNRYDPEIEYYYVRNRCYSPQTGWLGAIDNFLTWAVGHSGTTFYPPGSPDSRQMSQSTIGRALVRFFLNKNKGKPCEKWIGVSDLVGKFGLPGLEENLGNGTAEFVGSARGDVSVLSVQCNGTSGSVTARFKLTNTTSLTSFLYHIWPNSGNVTTPGRPFSNWTQIYEWTQAFNCRCCNSRGRSGD